jgi:hypothetical protein
MDKIVNLPEIVDIDAPGAWAPIWSTLNFGDALGPGPSSVARAPCHPRGHGRIYR